MSPVGGGLFKRRESAHSPIMPLLTELLTSLFWAFYKDGAPMGLHELPVNIDFHTASKCGTPAGYWLRA
jgi:hypothetical protein